jgi:hypothetical protein
MFYILQGRWTGTVTPRLLLQAGFSLNKQDFDVTYQPGIQKVPFTPDWYADVSQLDLTKVTRRVADGVNSYYKFERYVWNASAAYVNGSHQIKLGGSPNQIDPAAYHDAIGELEFDHFFSVFEARKMFAVFFEVLTQSFFYPPD